MAAATVKNAWLQLAHQLVTILVIPAVLGISAYGLNELIEIKVSLGVLSGVVPRVERLEEWKDAITRDVVERPRFDAKDARILEDRLISTIKEGDERVLDRVDRVTKRIELELQKRRGG